MRPTNLRRLLALIAALATVAATAACSGDDDASDDAEGADAADGRQRDGGDATATPADDVRVVTIDGAPSAGPAELDHVTVVQVGPEDAANVLVLEPGTSAGAGYFLPLAADLVDQLDGWQVWSIDRRENLLEDHAQLDRYLDGDATAQEIFDYYLGWLGDESITDHIQPRGGLDSTDDSVAFAREWGMDVTVDDLHAVIQEAASLGGHVVLGGHSLGGSITVAYATWDFDGRAGAEDLSGLVLIDGGSGAGQAPTPAEAEDELAELATGSPFNDLVNLNLPWAAGVFNALGASAALLHPDEPSLGWQSPLIPANLKPSVQPTNAGQYGYALDTETSPDGLELVQLHMGHLADSGDPRGWEDGELVPLERAATMFSGIEGIDGTAWYHPRRLSIDSGAVNGGIENPAQEVLGVRAIHGRELAVPIYALATSFGDGAVLAGAQALAEQAGIPDDDLTLVDESDRLAHTDPMAVDTAENPLVETLVPFLADIG